MMNGVIAFLKPPGMTSNNAVGFIKKTLNMKKVGHAGTLDPGACGVLVIMVGKATKLSDIFMSSSKKYIGEITFGHKTDTQDSYGQITESHDRVVTLDELKKVVPKFLGEIDQTPSKYSAIRVDGKKAYQLARAGEEVKLKSRKINIYDINVVKQTDIDSFLIEVSCSKGTYIRALFEDIGKELKTCAYMSFLERKESGGFKACNCFTADEICELNEQNRHDFLIDIPNSIENYERIDVIDSHYKKISNGVASSYIGTQKKENISYRVYCKNEFFGLGSISDDKVKLDIHLKEEN